VRRWTCTPAWRLSGGLTAAILRRVSPAVAQAFRTRVEREVADEALLAQHDADPDTAPSILSIRPSANSPVPSRLDRDIDVVRAGLEAGRTAAHAALGGDGASGGAPRCPRRATRPDPA
jgi:hypothetical protein